MKLIQKLGTTRAVFQSGQHVLTLEKHGVKLNPIFITCKRKLHVHTAAASKSQVDITKRADELKSSYDVVIIGAGHNGLVSAAYLQKAGYRVCVLERRHIIGGAAVTEEIIPNFKFSRASYVLSLLRPFIISDLKLQEFGLKFHMREPFSSFTPIKADRWGNSPSKYLLMGSNLKSTCEEISKFSKADATAYPHYEEQMSKFIKAINILLDNRPPPPNFGFGKGGKVAAASSSSLRERLQTLKTIGGAVAALGNELPSFHETLTASASKILNKWFESEPLKATLATDALIGNMAGPDTPGTGYVLLHHLMGGVNGKAGAWAYAEGGMGAVSHAIGSSAASLGAHIFTSKEVEQILYSSTGSDATAVGVVTTSGEQIKTRAVFSSATPQVTFKKLFPASEEIRKAILGSEFVQLVDQIDYVSPVTKINVAVSRLPNFLAKPNGRENEVQDLHKCTIHLNSESEEELKNSFSSVQKFNIPSENPMIEMVIPSSLDTTLAPPEAHVCLFFTQFTPMHPSNGSWTDSDYKEKYAQRVFDIVEEYSPGFKASIVGKDVLTPVDLENIFGLTGGNIFHGSMSLDQLYWLRPVFTRSSWFPKTPLKGLFLCGSGAHPGGGVMGLPGYLAAKVFIGSQ